MLQEITRKVTLAVVVHAFYVDVFEEILQHIGTMGLNLKLYVTTPFDQKNHVHQMLADSDMEFYLLPVENHGRDILPFLKIMSTVVGAGHEFVLKLHTKKSKHREDGELWRKDIYEKLMASESTKCILELLNSNHDIGMVCPEGHIVPMTTYWGSNKKSVVAGGAHGG